jgi:GNAT superfamily N-acetyltransferase
MTMRILTAKERYYFYQNYLVNDFHKNEIKPFDRMERLIEQGKYTCYGFFEETTPLGYAYFIKYPNEQLFLLDYFVVLKQYRSKGFGSDFLNEIKNQVLGNSSVLIAEVENPDYIEDEANKDDSKRRINFYLRNGFMQSNVLSQVFHCEYIMFAFGLEKINNKKLYEDVMKLYLDVFGYELFERYIHVRIVEEAD